MTSHCERPRTPCSASRASTPIGSSRPRRRCSNGSSSNSPTPTSAPLRRLVLVRGRPHLRQRTPLSGAPHRRQRTRPGGSGGAWARVAKWLGDECGLDGDVLRLPGHLGRRRGEPAGRRRRAAARRRRPRRGRAECVRAHATRRARRRAIRAFEWFLGRNRLRRPLYDFATGGCSDGLGAEALNDNEGAESTLAFHHAALLLDAAGIRAADREPRANPLRHERTRALPAPPRQPDPDRRGLAISRERCLQSGRRRRPRRNRAPRARRRPSRDLTPLRGALRERSRRLVGGARAASRPGRRDRASSGDSRTRASSGSTSSRAG